MRVKCQYSTKFIAKLIGFSKRIHKRVRMAFVVEVGGGGGEMWRPQFTRTDETSSTIRLEGKPVVFTTTK